MSGEKFGRTSGATSTRITRKKVPRRRREKTVRSEVEERNLFIVA
jgi:hypothetical protein